MGVGIENTEQLCLICSKSCVNRRSIGNHINRSHKDLGGQKGYVVRFFLGGKVPICKCGCGEEVSWHNRTYRFNDYVNGHNESGFVGFKHTPEQIEKRNKSIRQTYALNKKDLSERIGKAVSQAFKDPEKNRRLREGQVAGWRDDLERKEELSRRNIEMLEKGLIGPHAPFKQERIRNPWTGVEELMHSSWESAFFRDRIARGVRVTKLHGIVIPYVHPDGSRRNYIPDFLEEESRVLYEVKGRHDEVDDAKWEAARLWCGERGMRFECVFEEVVGEVNT